MNQFLLIVISIVTGIYISVLVELIFTVKKIKTRAANEMLRHLNDVVETKKAAQKELLEVKAALETLLKDAQQTSIKNTQHERKETAL